MNRLAVLLAAIVAVTPAFAAEPTIVLAARGVQIYNCTRVGENYAWTLMAPEAALTDAAGQPAGRHFGGPSWQAEDGSLVVGEALASSPAPGGGAIPWIVLRAKDHKGAGRFASVSHVVRGDTTGGLPPPGGCDAAHAGAEVRVGYTATYTFFNG